MTLQIPAKFIESVCNCPGFDEQAFINAHQTNSPTSIRVNPFKQTQLNFKLNNPVPWNQKGFYLEERPNFTHDMLFQAGCYYVQEAGSMFIEHALTSCVDSNSVKENAAINAKNIRLRNIKTPNIFLNKFFTLLIVMNCGSLCLKRATFIQ